MSKHVPAFHSEPVAPDARIAVIAARFNAHITDVLYQGCLDRLTELGIGAARVVLHRVPGAFELPVAAKMLADRGDISAIICIGCIIRGDTPHFDFVAAEAARGIQQVAISTGIPVIFGVLTVNTEQQALDRAGGSHSHAGRNAAEAALEMIALRSRIRKEGV